jgi:trimeric autotransporter adhesin
MTDFPRAFSEAGYFDWTRSMVDTGTGQTVNNGYGGPKPIILDLTGAGIKITELSQSNKFVIGDDGKMHRTAWAAAGCAVLFIDADGSGGISEAKEYVFTEWDPTARGDLEAIRSVFDTNHDGKLTSADAAFSQFRLEVTNADGSTSVMTLAQAGITSINLTADATNIELPDGSVITGQTAFTTSSGSTGTVANTSLATSTQGYATSQTVSVDGSGNRTVVTKGYDSSGALAFVYASVTSATGNSVSASYDDNGDGVVDRYQTIAKSVANGVKTETVSNYDGSYIFENRTTTVTSADGRAANDNCGYSRRCAA